MARHPEWTDLSVIYASTPDFAGSLEIGWASAVQAMIDALVEEEHRSRTLRQINLLPASYMTPADVEAIREIIESFGISVIVLPDLSGSLDGHVPDEYIPTTLGGTPIDQIARMGASQMTLAIGEHMRGAAEALERRAGVPFRIFDRLLGLEAFDSFVETLIALSGRPAPTRLRRERSRLVDAMLDGHFYFTGRTVAAAAEPDLLYAVTRFLDEMGCRIVAAVTTMKTPAVANILCDTVVVGDLDDLDRLVQPGGCDLVVANAHAEATAAALGAALYRAGFPVFDRLGAGHRVSVGYRGTRELLFDIGNLFMDRQAEPHPYERQGREAGNDANLASA
jgi:nitrogenase molybdenum-iron protein NifN